MMELVFFKWRFYDVNISLFDGGEKIHTNTSWVNMQTTSKAKAN